MKQEEQELLRKALHKKTSLRRLRGLVRLFPSEVLENLNNYEESRRTPAWLEVLQSARKEQALHATRAALAMAAERDRRLWFCDCVQEALRVCQSADIPYEKLSHALHVVRRFAAESSLFRARCLIEDIEEELHQVFNLRAKRSDKTYEDSQAASDSAVDCLLGALKLVTEPLKIYNDGIPHHPALQEGPALAAMAICLRELAEMTARCKMPESVGWSLVQSRQIDLAEQQAHFLIRRISPQTTQICVFSYMYRKGFARLYENHKNKQIMEQVQEALKKGAESSVRERLPCPSQTLDFDRALDPDTSPEMLKTLAETFPAQVARNPVLPLIALEDPALANHIGKTIERKTFYHQARVLLLDFTWEQMLLWVCLCASRALRWHRGKNRQLRLVLCALLQTLGIPKKQEIRKRWFETSEHLERVTQLFNATQQPNAARLEKEKCVLLAVFQIGYGQRLSTEAVIDCMQNAAEATPNPEEELAWQQEQMPLFVQTIDTCEPDRFSTLKTLIKDVAKCEDVLRLPRIQLALL